VNYPTTTSFNGTNQVTNPGNTYTYSFDAMMRPTGLKDQSNNTLVNNKRNLQRRESIADVQQRNPPIQ